jgi:hypothetical protein
MRALEATAHEVVLKVVAWAAELVQRRAEMAKRPQPLKAYVVVAGLQPEHVQE